MEYRSVETWKRLQKQIPIRSFEWQNSSCELDTRTESLSNRRPFPVAVYLKRYLVNLLLNVLQHYTVFLDLGEQGTSVSGCTVEIIRKYAFSIYITAKK